MAKIASACRFWLLAIVLACTAVANAAGDPPSFTYRTNVGEVRLIFSALDQNNHGVATLNAADFAVVDKSFIVRNFQSFTRADWTKVEVAVVIDASESVRPQFGQEVSDTLNLLSQTAGVPDENFSIFSFQSQKPALLCSGNCRASGIANHPPASPEGGLTPLFDTLLYASSYLSQHGDKHGAKILVLFSDGNDTISLHSLADAIDGAVNAEIQIYCISLETSSSPRQGKIVLDALSGATGGLVFPANAGADAVEQAILENFRATYTVTYHLPTHSAGFHRVRILPTRNVNLQFHSRSGYYYPARMD